MAAVRARTRGRRRAGVAVLAAGYVGVATTGSWLLGRDIGSALQSALVSAASCSVMVLVIVHLTGLRHRVVAAQGSLDVVVRSPDGHPRLSRGWRRAEVEPAAGELRFFPLAGPSVAPFTVAAHGLERLDDPRRWRDVLTGPVGDLRFLRIAEPDGTIEIAVPTEHLPQLLSVVHPGRSS